MFIFRFLVLIFGVLGPVRAPGAVVFFVRIGPISFPADVVRGD